MTPDDRPPPLTTVLAGGGEQIHLALALPPVPADVQLFTLCHRPVRVGVSTRRFHQLGCRECADLAVHLGVTSIQDLQHATVNLPRFLAGRGRAERLLP